MTLVSYKKKRDFAKTPEPKPLVLKRTRSASGIFVVHEHWATHYHFDFRLEMPSFAKATEGKKGVLKSWAVPKGPPEKIGEKRLAVQVEDHPLEYASFHGTIPEGQYGAGRVEIWDTGKLKIQEKTANSIKFELFGKKLKGSFSLFRPPTFEKKNWLLLKNK